MKFEERKELVIDTIRNMDPTGEGGIYLRDVAEVVALHDDGFLRRQEVYDKAARFVGVQRHQTDIGFKYLPRIYPVTARLESEGVIFSQLEQATEGPGNSRRRIYGFSSS